MRAIPNGFVHCFKGECPEKIKLKVSSGCIWDVDLMMENGKIVMDGGWSEFVKAHDLKEGYLPAFKKLDTRSLKVLIFYHNYCEIRIRCAGYHPSLKIGL
jgi:hypothetical protein